MPDTVLPDSSLPATLCRQHHVVSSDLEGQRLDQVLAKLIPEYSRNRLQQWVKQGLVLRNGTPCVDPKTKVWQGDLLDVGMQLRLEAGEDRAQDIPLDIVHEDEHILVLYKPAGLVVHPGSGNHDGTMLNALLHHAPSLANVPRAGIVHRLDKDTSGLLVVAKTLSAQTDLVRQLQARTVKRHYHAFVLGDLARGGTVDAPVGRHPTQRTRMAVVSSGREARTHYTVKERFAHATWVECVLDTGRTHQIRVHMAHLGYPLVGDAVYRGRRSVPPVAATFARQALHAFRLGLLHPATLEPLEWSIDLPDDMRQLLAKLRGEGTGDGI